MKIADRSIERITFFAALVGAALAAPQAWANGCGADQKAGRYSLAVTSGGQERTVVYFVPSRYDPSRQAPLVLDFHGSGSAGGEQLDRSEWERVAEREGFVAAAPQGLVAGPRPGTFSWNVPGVSAPGGPDDMVFIRDAIAALKNRFCVDDSRVYGTGFSGGGRLLSQYLCNGNREFAAAGLVVGLRAGYPREIDGQWQPDPATCNPARPVSIISISGLKDTTNPYNGGGQPYWRYGARAALERWVGLDGCKGEPEVRENGAARRTTYAACGEGARIVAFEIADNGHAWPASTALLKIQQDIGPVSYAINGTDEIWPFFQASAPSR